MVRRSDDTTTFLSGPLMRPALVVCCLAAAVIGIGVLVTTLRRGATPVKVGTAPSRQNSSAGNSNSTGSGHVKPGASRPRDPAQSAGPAQ
ncbi:MAG: hypothetical protein ABJA02_07160 [Acidobacteriota bacterium]